MIKAFQSGSDMKNSASALIHTAMEHGEKDNITAICVKITQTEQKEEPRPAKHWWNCLLMHKED